MEQILLSYGLSQEIVIGIMMIYKNIKVLVCSPDGDTNSIEIVSKV